MITPKMYLIGLMILVVKLVASRAEVDCNQPPPFVKFEDCCPLSSNIITEEVKEKCKGPENKNNFEPPPTSPENRPQGPPHGGPPGRGGHRGPPHHGPHPCFLQCVLNETGILVNGELQEDNLNTYLNQVSDDSEIVEVLSSKLKSCHDKHKEFAQNKPFNRHGPSGCMDGMLLGCLKMETFKDCPESDWSDTDECNAARDHFKECKPKWHKNNEESNVEVDEM